MSQHGKLSTHVLDTSRGIPAVGMKIDLRALPAGGLLESCVTIKSCVTNKDGRTDEPLLAGEAFTAGEYEITFYVGDYFADATFLDLVPVRFRIADPSLSYHVPLLCTPWAYSTYRGS